jgi:hypothetical protein
MGIKSGWVPRTLPTFVQLSLSPPFAMGHVHIEGHHGGLLGIFGYRRQKTPISLAGGKRKGKWLMSLDVQE